MPYSRRYGRRSYTRRTRRYKPRPSRKARKRYTKRRKVTALKPGSFKLYKKPINNMPGITSTKKILFDKTFNFTMAQTAGAIPGWQQLSANFELNRPRDISSTTENQMSGWNTWSGIYQEYRVLKSRITFKVTHAPLTSGTENPYAPIFMWMGTNKGGELIPDFTSIRSEFGAKNTKWKQFVPSDASQGTRPAYHKLSWTYEPKKFWPTQTIDINDSNTVNHGGWISTEANPSSQMKTQLIWETYDHTSSHYFIPTRYIECYIEMLVEFRNPLQFNNPNN